MAMENGVLFQTDRHWSMAVRRENGDIEVSSGEKTSLNRSSRLKRIPMLRGLVNLTESMMVLPAAHARGGQLPMMGRSPAVVASMLVSAVGTIAVRNPKKRLPPFVEELTVSALALLPSLVALRRNKAVQYHAAEHKSINAYETAGVLDEHVAEDATAEHPRCGSNIVGPALALMTVGNTLTRRYMGRHSSLGRLGVSVLSLSGSMEMIQWAARHPRSRWSRAITTPGSSLQNLVTTREPTEDQLDVGLAALRELLRLEGALDESGPAAGAVPSPQTA
jgi:uncharacterized protein YqhQ